MTDKKTPPDWVLIEAAKRSGWQVLDGDLCVPRYWLNNNGAFRALCDMIERHEPPHADRKVLCAREAAAHLYSGEPEEAEFKLGYRDERDQVVVAIRAIELYEEGFGK
jgi:hypothetical protein